ncbi:cupin domain-containing protein [Nocardia higoensis]|uniref:Cupin domain-containing protein n=1 Tax=Nocardia higoensis TaxID=228599 RepID=A0ABS0DJL0_9NOCA|nr:cupin domain-containing protein [Nocardia higoensis]MBF6358355.1 cupin domain-containing protein [Nocardia higoensis]
MTVVRHTENRRTETPGGVMTTLASPTQGGASAALWRVDVPPHTSGPVHEFDVEQIWTVLTGSLVVDLDGHSHDAAEGDTIVLPAGARRQISSGPEGYGAIVTAPAGARARTPQSDAPIVPAWIA